jgi:hypothetical protein
LIVVEATLARFVIALATRPVGRTLVPSSGPGDFGAATAIETAASRRRTAGEVGASIAHRAAVATTTATATGASAAVTTAATAAAVTAAATVAAATTAATIATATAATVAATTTASAVGRTRTTRTEAAAIATATAAATESAATTTTGLTFNGFAHGDRSTIEQRAVHGLHGRGALIICFHLEEGEAAAAAGLAIHDHF